MKFEYNIKKFHIQAYGLNEIKYELNEFGLCGWEVCGVVSMDKFIVYTLKRIINN